MSDCLPVTVSGAFHIYSLHSDVCISSAGDLTHVDDAPKSMIIVETSPAMVAYCNCLALSVAPYPVPIWLSFNSLRPILSAAALNNPTCISVNVAPSVMEYAVASGGTSAGIVGSSHHFWVSLKMVYIKELTWSNILVIAGSISHNNNRFDYFSSRRWQLGI